MAPGFGPANRNGPLSGGSRATVLTTSERMIFTCRLRQFTLFPFRIAAGHKPASHRRRGGKAMAVFQPAYSDKKTGEVKRQGVWWYEFVYAGERIRESAKTTRKTIAIEAEKDHRKRLERAHAGLPSEQPDQRIRNVAAVLKEYETQYGVGHRPRRLVLVQGLSKHVSRHSGTTLLPDVTHSRLVQYIEQRRAENGGNRTINLELMTLSRAMGSTWKALWPKLRKLEENQDVGRALESEEERRILDAAVHQLLETDLPVPDDPYMDWDAE